ncbi:MAG: CDP-alcohol phosphatidyltransferase family protein [Treponema sp.]
MEYKYDAHDASLMTPFLYRFFISPMLRIVPYQIPANIITIVANSCVLVSFIIAGMGYYKGNFDFYFLIPILCFLYLVGDCFDGVQARRTKTCSPLGEYFDHFLDSFVTGLLTGTLLFALRSTSPIVLIFPFQALYLGQIGTFWERLKKGVMSFGLISTSEGVMAIAIPSFLVSIPLVQRLIVVNKLIFSLSIMDLILLVAFFFAGVAGVKAIIASKKYSFKLLLHVIFSSFITISCVYFGFSILLTTLLTTFYNAFFISPLLSAISTGKEEKFPDLILPLLFVLYFFMKDWQSIISIAQLIYIVGRVVLRFSIFVFENRQYWVWKNKECVPIDILGKH